MDHLLNIRFTVTAEGHRRLEAAASSEPERLHWRRQAERFEELAALAMTDPAEARRRYMPTAAYQPTDA